MNPREIGPNISNHESDGSDYEPDELPLLHPLANLGEADYSGTVRRDY